MTVTETVLPSLAPHRVRSLIDRFTGLTVVIVGDIMLDHFIFGGVSRISPEAPVPVVEFDREEFQGWFRGTSGKRTRARRFRRCRRRCGSG